MGKGGGRKNSGRSLDCYTIECGTWNRIHKESIWNSKSQMYLKSQVLMDLNDRACIQTGLRHWKQKLQTITTRQSTLNN